MPVDTSPLHPSKYKKKRRVERTKVQVGDIGEYRDKGKEGIFWEEGFIGKRMGKGIGIGMCVRDRIKPIWQYRDRRI